MAYSITTLREENKMFYLVIDGKVEQESKDFDALVEVADANMEGQVVSKEDFEANSGDVK
jgi:hypothetical protein